MLVLRILGTLLIVVVGVSLVCFVVTRNPKWRRFAWQTLRLGVIILLIFMALYVLERLLVAI
ncbi:MAG TPA: hypothetical protein VF460_12675 [Burkholderiales bacterium]|jgi:hypothetical protein